jgi:hypothetical protein
MRILMKAPGPAKELDYLILEQKMNKAPIIIIQFMYDIMNGSLSGSVSLEISSTPNMHMDAYQ